MKSDLFLCRNHVGSDVSIRWSLGVKFDPQLEDFVEYLNYFLDWFPFFCQFREQSTVRQLLNNCLLLLDNETYPEVIYFHPSLF